MLLGPVFSLEMVTSARRTRHFVVRGLYGLILLFAFWMVYAESPVAYSRRADIASVANFTAEFFRTFAFLQLAAVLLLGPAMAAGTIAGERQRRTIELLFTANLSNAEIVFSKLGARLIHIVMLLLVGLPILALAMLLGGIAPEALVVVYAITLSTVLAVATLSIAVSVWSARVRDAVTRAYAVLLALLVLPLLLYLVRSHNAFFYDTFLAPLNDHLLAANPLWVMPIAVFQASGTATAGGWQLVVALVRSQMIISALSVIAAMVAVRRVHLRQMGTAARKRRRLQLIRPRIGNNPMLWKELFAEPAASRLGVVGWIAMGVLVLGVLGPSIWMFVDVLAGDGDYRYAIFQMYSGTMGTLVGCGALLLLAAQSASAVTSEKERNCWGSLIGTPLTGGEVVRAKILGSLYAVRGVLWILAVLWVMNVIVEPTFLIAIPFLLGTLLLLALFVSSLGVMFSLRSRNSVRSMAATLGTCLFLGGGYLFCCMPVMFKAGGGGEDIMLAACMPFLLVSPWMVAVEGGPPPPPAELVAAFVIGIVGYLTATVVIYHSSVDCFDAWVGRVQPFTGLWSTHGTDKTAHSTRPSSDPH